MSRRLVPYVGQYSAMPGSEKLLEDPFVSLHSDARECILPCPMSTSSESIGCSGVEELLVESKIPSPSIVGKGVLMVRRTRGGFHR